MKVSRTSSAGAKKLSKSSKPTQATAKISFKELLDIADDEQNQKEFLDNMLDDIKEKGRDLVEKRTVENLFEYKEMIKGFIEEAVNFGLKVEERKGMNRGSRGKILRVVSKIDEKLLELTDAIIGEENSKIKILEKIGQIQGLLVNLYV